MKIVFFGTPDFGVPALRALAVSHEVVAVVTQPDRAGNRGKVTFPAVKTAALELGIPVLQFEKIRDRLGEIRALGAEIGVTAAYGQILSQALLDSFPRGIINVHGSLLPAYRGSSPIQWAVINGEAETGITIMQTARGVDSGDILSRVVTPIGEEETAGELFDRLALLAPELLLDTLAGIEAGTVTPVPQDESQATHFPMLTKGTGRIDWTKSARAVHNLVRGVYPWPGAQFEFAGARYKIAAVRVTEGEGEAGEVLVSDPARGLVVACGGGAVRVLVIQAEGGKAMPAETYLRGHSIPVGSKLC